MSTENVYSSDLDCEWHKAIWNDMENGYMKIHFHNGNNAIF
jgi:hypothetical protein